MTTKRLLQRLNLTDAALEKIEQAVKAEENRTTGEIAAAVTPESASYSFYELLASLIAGGIVYAFMLCFSGSISAWLDTLVWQLPVWLFPLIAGAVFFIAVPLFFFLANISAVDRCIIPRFAQNMATWKRAQRCFTESGVYKTREQSGILIFVSYLERNVHILADSGIAAKINQQKWDEIAAVLADEIASKGAETAFCNAIHACGNLLAEHFPPHENDNPDELSDGLIILEGGE